MELAAKDIVMGNGCGQLFSVFCSGNECVSTILRIIKPFRIILTFTCIVERWRLYQNPRLAGRNPSQLYPNPYPLNESSWRRKHAPHHQKEWLEGDNMIWLIGIIFFLLVLCIPLDNEEYATNKQINKLASASRKRAQIRQSLHRPWFG